MPRLIRVRPGADLGYRRVRSGGGFRYVDADGAALPAEERERVVALVIPPAWTDVWISAEPRGHIQVTGIDDAGRMQYLYHPDWSAGRDKGKYARALQLAEALPRARARVTTSLRRDDLGRERVLAAAFRLLDLAAPRVGSERYLVSHGSRGLTTLRRRDAAVAASVTSLRFRGKSGKWQSLDVDDGELAVAVALLVAGRPASPLLAYERRRRRVALTPKDVNAYVRTMTGGAFTAKDFRTLRGTILAADALARIGPAATGRDRKQAEVLAVKAAAAALGNTPSVARSSYIDPRVFARYRRGVLLDTSVSPESAIRALILN
ncbi:MULTISPECIES: DNA topoisomerase IB [unclassified Microbacterium]|uniref:DNA topoisomerase IB n=1 Tax=unclassified Microbacterium TaxID=2609290 RepID=UPI00301ADE12